MSCLVCSGVDLYEENLYNSFPLVKKLKICIPEIEWENTDKFCNACAVEVDKFQYFKTECLKAYLLHRKKPLSVLGDLIQDPQQQQIINGDSPSQTVSYSIDGLNDDSNDPLDTLHNVEQTTYQGTGQNVKNNGIKSDLENAADLVTNIAAKECKESATGKGRKPVRKYSCQVCGEFFKFASKVVDHAISAHDMAGQVIKPYSCELCQMRFSCSGNLIQHKKYHDRTRSLMCAYCGKAYITKSDLKVHELTHNNQRRYKCAKCGKAFNTNKTLRGHDLVCHTEPELWKHVCPICNKRFPLKSGHDEHVKRHLGYKKHDCHLCEKSFVSPTELKKHMTIHSNVRKFVCLICEREYKDNKVYQIHLKKVHDIGDAKVPVRTKKLTCHVCGDMFVDKQKLKRHMYTHTGVKPFPCDMCSKRFTDKSYLKKHKRTVHGILEIDDNCYITIL